MMNNEANTNKWNDTKPSDNKIIYQFWGLLKCTMARSDHQ